MAQDKRPPPGGHGGHSVPSGGPRRGRGKGAGAGRLRRLIPLSRGAILSPVGIGWSEVFLGTGRADGRLLMRPRPRHEDGDLEGAQRFDGHCEGRDGWGAPGAGRVDGGDDGASLPSPETLSPAGGLPARGGGGTALPEIGEEPPSPRMGASSSSIRIGCTEYRGSSDRRDGDGRGLDRPPGPPDRGAAGSDSCGPRVPQGPPPSGAHWNLGQGRAHVLVGVKK